MGVLLLIARSLEQRRVRRLLLHVVSLAVIQHGPLVCRMVELSLKILRQNSRKS